MFTVATQLILTLLVSSAQSNTIKQRARVMCRVGHSVQVAHGKCRVFFLVVVLSQSYNKAMQQGLGIRERMPWRMDIVSQNTIVHRRSWGRPGKAELGQVSGLVQPLGSFWSFAGMYIHCLFTVFTLNSAAPFKLTFTFGNALHTCCIIASPTAHHLTTICPARWFVADATSRAQRTLMTKWHINKYKGETCLTQNSILSQLL